MICDPLAYNRRTLRLKGYDYSSNGSYFITICTKDRNEYFGSINLQKGCECIDIRHLNEYGYIIESGWMNIANIYENIEIDQYIIMPNHIHGIIHISVSNNMFTKSLNHIIGQFKSSMTKQLKRNGLDLFEWQRNYYEHIIRNEQELNNIREYIINNPMNWNKDEYYR